MTESQTQSQFSKLAPKTWLAFILLGFAGLLAWGVENQYFDTFTYNNNTPDPRPISRMVAACALTATLMALGLQIFAREIRNQG